MVEFNVSVAVNSSVSIYTHNSNITIEGNFVVTFNGNSHAKNSQGVGIHFTTYSVVAIAAWKFLG